MAYEPSRRDLEFRNAMLNGKRPNTYEVARLLHGVSYPYLSTIAHDNLQGGLRAQIEVEIARRQSRSANVALIVSVVAIMVGVIL